MKSHLWGTDLNEDEKGGLWVLVFPKSKEAGGVVDTQAMREQPLQHARDIFIRDKYTEAGGLIGEDLETAFTEKDRSAKATISEELFQNVVREHIQKICVHSGFKVHCFESGDGDEIFMVLDITDAEVLSQMAMRYRYNLPYRGEVYKEMKMMPPEPPTSSFGNILCAYGEYEGTNKHELQDFRRIDKIRIMKTRINHKMALETLLEKKIISAYFPVQDQENDAELHREWIQVWGLSARTPDLIRDAFGEEITFFFLWLEYYTAMLCPLVLLTMGTSVAAMIFKGTAWIRTLVIGTVILAWGGFFGSLFEFNCAQHRVRWGMMHFKPAFADLPSFRIELQGTKRMSAQYILVTCVQVLYVLVFIGTISFLQVAEGEARMRKDMDSPFVKYGSVLTVVVIKLSAFLWSKIAPFLVWLENVQTERMWENAMSKKVAGMTIFVALWNFVYLAFIKCHLPTLCAEDADHIIDTVWLGLTASQDQRDFLQETYMYTARAGDMCLRGCFPLTPDQSHPHGQTGCDLELEEDLFTYFAFDILVTVVFLCVPILIIRYDVRKEISKAKKMGKAFTWLELQSKRFAQARYAYKSYGGSIVEDFMQFATHFALLTCFGILYPPVIWIALAANIVQYKIIAYRMVHITCRPEPKGSAGIGAWGEIFSIISKIAIVSNAGLAVFRMYPGRHWCLQHQLVAFVILEHSLLALYSAATALLPTMPSDLAKIDAFNSNFLLTFERRFLLTLPEESALGYKEGCLDVGGGDGSQKQLAA